MAQTFARIEVSIRRRQIRETVKTVLGAAIVLGGSALAVYHYVF